MKFVCDACGKKYATSEDPSPGKVYKLKCRACGHLIVVKSQAGTSTAIPAMTAAELSAGGGTPGSQAPELEIDIEPEQHYPSPAMSVPTAVDDDAIIEDPAPLPPEVVSAIDGATPLPTDPPPELSLEDHPPRPQVLPAPPPGKDELADFAAAAAEVMAAPAAGAGSRQGYVDLFGDGVTGERPVQGGALSAAARSSLPSGYTGSDPLKPTKPTKAPAPPRAAPPRPAPPKPASKGKGPSPLIFVVLGAVLIGGITIAAITSSSKKAEPAPPQPPLAAPAPLPAPRAEPPPLKPEPPPRAPEKKPEPKPEARPEPKPEPPRAEPPKVKPPERRPEAKPPERKPEPRPEPKPEAKPEPRPPPAPPPAPVEARTETRDVQLADAETALTPEIVQKVINANKKAFASCIAAAGSDVRLDGRKVVLKLTVNANGAVTYPTLDDVTLNPTEMGQCLKSAARLMIFPKFKGDPFHVEVPLTLSN